MATNGYRPGDWKRVCDVCGFDYYASQTRKRWDGLIVCDADFESRHPQDYVRGRKDRQNVPDPRPVPAAVYAGPDGGPWILVESGQWRVDGGNIRIFGDSAETVSVNDL